MHKIKPTKHIVAFIDILGGEHIIYNDKNNYYLNNIKYLYDYFGTFLDKQKNNKLRYIDINIFSDNILISSEVHYETAIMVRKTINEFFILVSQFQLMALLKGIPIRGGISYGDLYIDNKNFVWGKALVEAYKLEKRAIYPRIKVGAKAMILLQEIDKKYKSVSFLNHLPIVKGKDKVPYVYYINNILKSSNEENTLLHIKDFLLLQIQQFKTNEKIRSKWQWLINEFNEYCEVREKDNMKIIQ